MITHAHIYKRYNGDLTCKGQKIIMILYLVLWFKCNFLIHWQGLHVHVTWMGIFTHQVLLGFERRVFLF